MPRSETFAEDWIVPEMEKKKILPDNAPVITQKFVEGHRNVMDIEEFGLILELDASFISCRKFNAFIFPEQAKYAEDWKSFLNLWSFCHYGIK